MWCCAADYNAERDDGVVAAGGFLGHHRYLYGAMHPDHRRAVDARFRGHFLGTGQQRITDCAVPGARDNTEPHAGGIELRNFRNADSTHKAPPNSPGRWTDSWKSSSPSKSCPILSRLVIR